MKFHREVTHKAKREEAKKREECHDTCPKTAKLWHKEVVSGQPEKT